MRAVAFLTGGRRLWSHRDLEDSCTWDARWSISPRRWRNCLVSDSLTIGGSANGGLTPSSDIYVGQTVENPSSGSHDFRAGGRGDVSFGPAPSSLVPGGISDNPQLHVLEIPLYAESIEHIPFNQWGALSDSADSCYGIDVGGNRPIRSQRPCCFCIPNVVDAFQHLACSNFPNDSREFRVGGKRANGEKPTRKRHRRDFSEKILAVARKSLYLWFFAGDPSASDTDVLRLCSNSEDAYYARQGRRFARELADARSFYNAYRA